MIEKDLFYNGDLIESVKFKKGLQVRPLWSQMEHLKPHEAILWADRFDSLCAISGEWAVAQAFETSAQVTLTKKAQFERTILSEINRLVWSCTFLGRLMAALGQKSFLQQALILRELILTMQEELTGGRILPQALKIGGSRRVLALGNLQKIKTFLTEWILVWDEWKDTVFNDILLESRLRGLLPLGSDLIEALGWWGPIGKASGVPYDSRKHRPHGAYPYFDFTIPAEQSGDAWGRTRVVVAEIDLSIKLLKALVEQMFSQVSDLGGEGRNEPKSADTSFRPGYFSGTAESAKGPVISLVEMGEHGRILTLRIFSAGQRVWPGLERLFKGLRGEDFEVALASIGIDPEDSEI